MNARMIEVEKRIGAIETQLEQKQYKDEQKVIQINFILNDLKQLLDQWSNLNNE